MPERPHPDAYYARWIRSAWTAGRPAVRPDDLSAGQWLSIVGRLARDEGLDVNIDVDERGRVSATVVGDSVRDRIRRRLGLDGR